MSAAPSSGSSWWRTLFGATGLLLLAVPGFALGLFAGVAWREPALVAEHLLGRTREVALAPPRGSAPATADVAAPPPVTASAAEAPREAAPAPAAAEAAAAPAAPAEREIASLSARGARLSVQVGAFGDAASAEKLADALRAKRFEAYVSPSTGDAGQRWRVRVGPFASREEADRVAARLKSEARLPTWVVDDGRS